jgi:hypothetical protein
MSMHKYPPPMPHDLHIFSMIHIYLGRDDQVVSCFTMGKAYGWGTFPKCKVTFYYLLPPLKLLILGMLAP